VVRAALRQADELSDEGNTDVPLADDADEFSG
jgi:hypothetical protein